MIEEALVSYLQAYAGLVSLSVAWYPLKAPDGPGACYGIIRRASGARIRTMGGPTGLAHPAFELEIHGTTYSAVLAAAKQVRLALDGYCLANGTMGTQAVRVHSVSLEDDETDDYDYQTRRFVRLIPVVVWHEESLS